LGEARYRQKMAHLQQVKRAYAAYDEGRKALKEGDSRTASRLAQKAIAIEPKEALFYALKGDALLEEKQYQTALSLYNKALQLNPNFFHFYVQRGVVRQQLGDVQGARKDFELSTKLLPTDTAMNGLGKLALAANDRQSAIKYFEVAAASNSPAGKQAKANLVRLDLAKRPQRYLQLRTGVDRRGYVVAQVENATPVAVTDVRVVFQYRDATGRIRNFTAPVHSIIEPGGRAQVATRLGPLSDASALRNIKVGIVAARAAQ
jgi:Flp pilus assembly protein TadD